jgi:hypothetical protein
MRDINALRRRYYLITDLLAIPRKKSYKVFKQYN